MRAAWLWLWFYGHGLEAKFEVDSTEVDQELTRYIIECESSALPHKPNPGPAPRGQDQHTGHPQTTHEASAIAC